MTVDIMHLLRRLNHEGMTVVVVTHEPDVAAYANRVVTFKDGKIIDIHINDHREGKSVIAMDPS
jgi:putative ABC transport system ATP-binding protein